MASQFFSRTFNARIRIRVAHTEYYKAFLQGLTFAEGVCISDAGADTWVIRGKSWHVEAFDDHQKARLVGHDQMVSAQALPFAILAIAWLQITPSKGCLVWVNEAIVNKEMDITLISKYQSCNGGAIVDSISTKHKISEDRMGTQQCVFLDGTLTIPLQLRQSLMTFQVTKPTAKQLRDHQDNDIELNGKGMWNPSEHNDIPGPLAMFRASTIQKFASDKLNLRFTAIESG